MKRRRVLLTIAGLGSVVALLGLVGLIAPFTDRATTGTNSIESGERAREVDLQLASYSAGQCLQFTDDLATGLISVSDVQSSTGGDGTGVCVKNSGSSTASVTFTALDVSDVDIACTGDEAAVDIGSCGNGAAGELSPQLSVGFEGDGCTLQRQGVIAESRLDLLATTSSPLLTSQSSPLALAPGEVACFQARWFYFPATAGDATVSQTDLATWRFAFDGTTP